MIIEVIPSRQRLEIEVIDLGKVVEVLEIKPTPQTIQTGSQTLVQIFNNENPNATIDGGLIL